MLKMARGMDQVLLVGLVVSLVQAQLSQETVKAVSVRNTERYPICISDSDCDTTSEKARLDHHIKIMCHRCQRLLLLKKGAVNV